jgi:cysteinyl-tRNA synthetase
VKEFEKLETAMKQLHRKLDLMNEIQDVQIDDSEIMGMVDAFNEAMENDFNTANAITALQSLIKMINKALRQRVETSLYQQMFSAIQYMTSILGLKVDVQSLTQEDKKIYHDWQNARKEKQFDKADELRDVLTKRGIL